MIDTSDSRELTVRELQDRGVLLVEDGNHGDDRPRPDEFADEGVAFIRAADMDRGRVLFDRASNINAVARQRIRKGIGAPGDVLLSHKGTVGKVALVPLEAPAFVCSPQTTFWRSLNRDELDRRFLFAYLKSAVFQNQLTAFKGETDMADYVSLTNQRGLKVPVPPIGIQRAIAGVLGALDDKIDLNARTNETLEAMARALFTSWFVDFDPVRAKAKGRPPACMDPDTAALFPASFAAGELGPIPAGWSVSTLKNVTSKIGSGATPRGGDRSYVNFGTAFIRSQNVYDSLFVWDGLARISDEAAEQLRGVTVQNGDVLINITGASILRTCVVERAVLPARVSQHVAIVRATPGVPPEYIHQHLLQPATKSYLLGMDAGGSRQAVTKGHLESVRLVLPPGLVLARFAELTEPMSETVNANNEQTRTLGLIRDALLPKLLSGALRVRDADRIVERAV